MPKYQTNLKNVEDAFDRDALARICAMDERDFAGAFDMRTLGGFDEMRRKGDEDYYHFRDNGANVLAVAHLDTVQPHHKREANFLETASGTVVYSGALDDRLGAYIILDLLPRLDIRYDWLLTVGEESGMSTAEFFDMPAGKDYDWIIEFDRGGTDVVMYDYEDSDTVAAVRATGARVGAGIFSDICYLEHLGIKGFNWGVGYRDYHSPRSHAYIDDTLSMVARYLKFDQQNRGTWMPHVPQRDSWGRAKVSPHNWWDDDDTFLDVPKDIDDWDYVSDDPTQEELERLEERLDYQRALERLDWANPGRRDDTLDSGWLEV